MTGKYKIAGFPVIIDSVYDYVQRLCSDFHFEGLGESELYIKTTQKEIDEQRQKLKMTNPPVENMSDEQVESFAVYVKFCQLITERGCLIIQGCAVSSYGTAYLFIPGYDTNKFPDKKPCHCRFSNTIEIVNEKNPIIRLKNNGIYVYSSPWCDKKIIKKAQHVPLSAICILTTVDTDLIEEISLSNAYGVILRQCHSFISPEYLSGSLNNLKRILNKVRIYTLGSRAEPSAAVVNFEGLKKRRKNTIL